MEYHYVVMDHRGFPIATCDTLAAADVVVSASMKGQIDDLQAHPTSFHIAKVKHYVTGTFAKAQPADE